jgi:pyrimidine-nucleoside phosphorylase
MNMIDIIEKKKNKGALSKEQIGYFVQGYTRGDIPDYQASALLMAICLNKMDDAETRILTESMMHSGDMLDLSASKAPSTISTRRRRGDKTTLVLAPMLAACGMKIAKMSGRGLVLQAERSTSSKARRLYDRLDSAGFIAQVNNVALPWRPRRRTSPLRIKKSMRCVTYRHSR